MGTRLRMAISCARRILVTVSGHQEPALTVASLATMIGGAAFDFADAGDDACARRLAIILIVGDQQADFEERRARIEQLRDPLARRHLAGAVLFFDSLGAAAQAQFVFKRLQIFNKLTHLRRTGGGHHSQNTVRSSRYAKGLLGIDPRARALPGQYFCWHCYWPRPTQSADAGSVCHRPAVRLFAGATGWAGRAHHPAASVTANRAGDGLSGFGGSDCGASVDAWLAPGG